MPPQDIADGRVRIQMIEGGIAQVELKGDGAEQFGVRPMLDAVLAEQPSRLATLERQLLLINGRPGVRIDDTALEEIGTASGRFRLIVDLKTWHVFASFGLDNLGSSSVGPWQTYATGAFNSYLTPGDTLAVNLSTTPGDPRQLAFGRLSYDVPVGIDGVRLGASGLYSEVRPGDYRRLFSDNTRTEAFELRGSICRCSRSRPTLTLTAATVFSNVSENDLFGPFYNDHISTVNLTADYRLQDDFGGTNYLDADLAPGARHLRCLAFRRRFPVARRRVRQILRAELLVHALPDHQRRLVAQALGRQPDGLAAAVHFAAILSRRRWPSAAAMALPRSAATTALPARSNCASTRSSISAIWTGYQLYGFVDAGAAWNDGYRLSDGLSLTSAGAGVRFFCRMISRPISASPPP